MSPPFGDKELSRTSQRLESATLSIRSRVCLCMLEVDPYLVDRVKLTGTLPPTHSPMAIVRCSN